MFGDFRALKISAWLLSASTMPQCHQRPAAHQSSIVGVPTVAQEPQVHQSNRVLIIYNYSIIYSPFLYLKLLIVYSKVPRIRETIGVFARKRICTTIRGELKATRQRLDGVEKAPKETQHGLATTSETPAHVSSTQSNPTSPFVTVMNWRISPIRWQVTIQN